MARVPYLPADLSEPRETVEAMRARRGGSLARVDRLLLHSPPLAHAWTIYANTIRTKLSLPARLRELATLAVAVLMRTEHEVNVHGPHFLAAGGSQEQLQALRQVEAAIANTELFDAGERAVLALAFEMTNSIDVTDGTFAVVRQALGDTQQVVELVAVIGTYNMSNRFLMALNFELG